MQGLRRILCIGGSGALGSSVLRSMSSGYALTNIDFKESNDVKHAQNVVLQKGKSPQQNLEQIKKNLQNKRFDAIIVTAGGWRGGNIKSQSFIQDYEAMRDMNLLPCLYAGHLAATALQRQGMLIFVGAAAVFKEPQPEMIAYSLAKTGVHSLALNLSQSNVLPEDTTVITILPETIDTPANRQAMPKANFDEWSKPHQIAELLKGWIDGLNRPSNGSFAVLKVKNKSIVPQFI